MKMLFRATALALSLLIGNAQAQMGSFFPGPGGVVAGGATFTDFASATKSGCGFVSSCQITAALPVTSGFNVFAAIVNNSAAGVATITTLTLSGGCSGALTLQAATGSASGGGASVALFYGTVVGGTCTVTVADSSVNGIGAAGVAVGRLGSLGSTTPGTGCTGYYTPNGGSTYPCTSSITVPSGGFGVAAIGYLNATPMTSSNMTIRSQANQTSMSIGIASTRTTSTPTFGGVGFLHGAIVAAPWS